MEDKAETTSKPGDQAIENTEDTPCEEGDCLLEVTGTSSDQAAEEIEEKPFQDGDCELEEKMKSNQTEPKSNGSDQRDTAEKIEKTTEEHSNDVEQDKQPDDADQEAKDEEGAIGVRSSSSPTSSYRTEPDEVSEVGELPPCTVNDPTCLFAECDVHKELCDICQTHCLEPDDNEQRQLHRITCKKDRFSQQQYLIGLQQSYDKECGICMEVVMSKRPREQRFGILPKCKHVFCLKCIRSWRKVSTLNPTVRRGCPMCRVVSYFVCPSFVWVENRQAKCKLIAKYKKACSAIPCKYVQQPDGTCPFRGRCFYRHVLDVETGNDTISCSTWTWAE